MKDARVRCFVLGRRDNSRRIFTAGADFSAAFPSESGVKMFICHDILAFMDGMIIAVVRMLSLTDKADSRVEESKDENREFLGGMSCAIQNLNFWLFRYASCLR
ncbi:MAG TPA: hypothetical protein PKW95_09195 [bacterium]|nr:hypothetical protein [bacterium]